MRGQPRIHYHPDPEGRPLSLREMEIVGLAAQGVTNYQIAESLGVALQTVKNTLTSCYLKLGVHNRTAAVGAILGDEEGRMPDEIHHSEQHVIHGVTVPLGKLIRDAIRSRNNQQQGEIMATLQEIVDATRKNGAEARAAIARVAEDFQTLSDQIAALQTKITDLQAQVDQGVNNDAELASLRARLAEFDTGLDEVATGLADTTAGLTGLDPIPNSPAPPA